MEKSPKEKHIAELKASGLNDQTISLSGIYSATAEEVVQLGFKLNSTAMVIPYGDGCVRLKPDSPRIDKEGRSIKYETLVGTPARIYFPPNLNNEVFQNTAIPLVITEGEKKALKAVQEGIPTISIPGVWTFRIKDTMQLIPDFEKINFENRTIYITFDSDVSDNQNMQQAEWMLGRLLMDRKKANVKIVRIPK